jgi:hypothetical protein
MASSNDLALEVSAEVDAPAEKLDTPAEKTDTEPSRVPKKKGGGRGGDDEKNDKDSKKKKSIPSDVTRHSLDAVA